MSSQNRFQKQANFALTLFAAPAAGLLIWYFITGSSVAKLLLHCYVLVATPLYVLNGSYPPFGSRWFWKAMLPIAVMVSVAGYVQIEITDWFRYIGVSLPARMAFGFTAGFAMLEAVAALKIVDATAPGRSFDRPSGQ